MAGPAHKPEGEPFLSGQGVGGAQVAAVGGLGPRARAGDQQPGHAVQDLDQLGYQPAALCGVGVPFPEPDRPGAAGDGFSHDGGERSTARLGTVSHDQERRQWARRPAPSARERLPGHGLRQNAGPGHSLGIPVEVVLAWAK